MKTLLALTLICGATLPALAGAVQPDYQDKLSFDASKVVYSKDPQTGLCFAATNAMVYKSKDWFTNDYVVMPTYVPCTKEVEALIGK